MSEVVKPFAVEERMGAQLAGPQKYKKQTFPTFSFADPPYTYPKKGIFPVKKKRRKRRQNPADRGLISRPNTSARRLNRQFDELLKTLTPVLSGIEDEIDRKKLRQAIQAIREIKPTPKKSDRPMDFVKQERKKRGWTQTELGKKSNLSQDRTSRIERWEDWRLKALVQVCDALQISGNRAFRAIRKGKR